MNILLCVKQVPDTERNAPDYTEGTNLVNRADSPSVINVFDSYAVEAAARLKEQLPETVVTVLTAGPEQAKAVLKEALSISADKAYHICDSAFAGMDAPATAATIASAVKKLEEQEGGFGAVFCGKLAADGETSAVPAGIAEALDCAYASGCIEAVAQDGKLVVRRETKNGFELIECSTPCVVSFDKPEGAFRFPTIKKKLAANRAVIPQLSSAELGAAPESATKVVRVYRPEKSSSCVTFKCDTPEEAVRNLLERMSGDNRGII